jgi:hypothetical protein
LCIKFSESCFQTSQLTFFASRRLIGTCGGQRASSGRDVAGHKSAEARLAGPFVQMPCVHLSFGAQKNRAQTLEHGTRLSIFGKYFHLVCVARKRKTAELVQINTHKANNKSSSLLYLRGSPAAAETHNVPLWADLQRPDFKLILATLFKPFKQRGISLSNISLM